MYNYKAKCVRVVDGDTLDLEIDLGFNIKIKERVRLARVNTPEIRGKERPEGLIAKEFVSDVLSEEVFVDEVDDHGYYVTHQKPIYVTTAKNKGKYGRWVAEITYEENGNMYNLSDVLLKEGLAEEVDYD